MHAASHSVHRAPGQAPGPGAPQACTAWVSTPCNCRAAYLHRSCSYTVAGCGWSQHSTLRAQLSFHLALLAVKPAFTRFVRAGCDGFGAAQTGTAQCARAGQAPPHAVPTSLTAQRSTTIGVCTSSGPPHMYRQPHGRSSHWWHKATSHRAACDSCRVPERECADSGTEHPSDAERCGVDHLFELIFPPAVAPTL